MAYRQTTQTRNRLQQRREDIVGATRRIIASHGLAGVTMQSVAKEAGAATGTVYRYFPSKTALLADVVTAICERELALVSEVSMNAELTAPERLRAAVEVFSRRAIASGRTAYAVIAEPSVVEIEEVRTAIRRDLAARFTRIVRDGVEAGSFPAQSADVVGVAIVGAVSEVLVGPVGSAPRPLGDSVKRAGEVAEFVMRSVGGQSTHPEAIGAS